MIQSRVLCEQNTFAFNGAVDEIDMLGREEELARLAKVQEIDLSYQGIYSLHPYSEERLQGLSFELYAFDSLCKLDLSHNHLFKHPESIGSLLSLTHLFLNDNYLSSLQPEIIRRLVNL